MLAQEFDDELRRQVWHEPKIQTCHRVTRQDCFRPRFSVSRLNSADRTGRPEDVLFDERRAAHSAHPAADAKLALESGFIESNLFEGFRVFRRDRRNVR